MVAPALISQNSRFFENLLEHRFLYDLCKVLVLRDPPVITNIMRSEVDAFGVDLVVAAARQTVHLQMKTRSRTVEPNPYDISEGLWLLPSAAVVWMLYNPTDLEPISYYIFGLPLPAMSEFPLSKRKGFRGVKMKHAQHKALSLGQVADLLFPKNAYKAVPDDVALVSLT